MHTRDTTDTEMFLEKLSAEQRRLCLASFKKPLSSPKNRAPVSAAGGGGLVGHACSILEANVNCEESLKITEVGGV